MGPYLGYQPTSKAISWKSNVVYELTPQGTVSREAYYYDSAGVLSQLEG